MWFVVWQIARKEKNMQFEVFCSKVKEQLETHFYEAGLEMELMIHDITKNNGVKLKGISIREVGKQLSPNIYLNGYYRLYQDGSSLERIVEKILLVYERNGLESIDLEFFTIFDRVRDRIVYKLVNYEQNQELLQNLPHMRYLDMAVVFYYLLSEDAMNHASIMIKQEHLELWKVSKADVFKAAAINTPRLLEPTIISMENVVTSCCEKTMEEYPEKRESAEALMEDIKHMEENHPSYMYILSNSENMYGASCVLYKGVLQDFAGTLNSNLFVLPCSVHEMILIPANVEADPQYLAQMVWEINRDAVNREEVLSDHIYYYDRETDEMQLCA